MQLLTGRTVWKNCTPVQAADTPGQCTVAGTLILVDTSHVNGESEHRSKRF